MSADAADILTSLYALRSQAGVVRTHAERQHRLTLAADLAAIQIEVSQLIETTQKVESDEGQQFSSGQNPRA